MTISALLYKYPLDLTGKNPTNLVLREPHTIGSVTNRAFVTNSGPFYTKDVVVREATSGKVLVPYTQYLILQPYQEASVKTGLDVAAIIYITDASVDTEILVDYQCVGGEFSWSVYALKAMLEAAELDSRPVHWGDIVGKPTEFRPSPHLHDLGDSYGWEYITVQLEGIRNAILIGDAASHDEIRQQLELSLNIIRNTAAENNAAFLLHKNDLNDPHNVTAAQVGLGNVLNSRHATDAEASYAANPDNIAPITTYVIDVKNLNAAMRAFEAAAVTPHINDLNDPHNVTATQVGLGSVQNYGMSTKVEAEQGLTELKYMSPLRTKEAIAKLALEPLTTHINNKNDPHDVTKEQVGLGLVQNYSHVTALEAKQAGTLTYDSSACFNVMGAYGASLAFQEYDRITAKAHREDYGNSHKVTKAQVALGNVANYPVASYIDAVSSFDNNLSIFNNWTRYSHVLSENWNAVSTYAWTAVVYYGGEQWQSLKSVPANQVPFVGSTYWAVYDEKNSITYNSSTQVFQSVTNSVGTVGMASDMTFNDYSWDVDVTSVATDDDEIGLVAAYINTGLAINTLSVVRTLNNPYGFQVWFNHRLPGQRLLAAKTGGVPTELLNGTLYNTYSATRPNGTPSIMLRTGWQWRVDVNSPWQNVKFRMRSKRVGNKFYFYTSAANSTAISTTDADTQVIVDLDLPGNADMVDLLNPCSIGYEVFSQPGAMWTPINFPWRRNDVYMTPWRVKDAIDYYRVNTLNPTFATIASLQAHTVSGGTNPHGTTKGDVVLGSVENYGIASTVEAQQGLVSNKYMTPLRTKEAINLIAGGLVASHSGIIGNPHGTSASQVGAYTVAQTNALVYEYALGGGWGINGVGWQTVTLPSWVKKFRIVASGGGGGGAVGAATGRAANQVGSDNGRGGGGGAGAYYEFAGHTSLWGHTFTFYVGAGGAGATATPSGMNGGGGESTVLFGGAVVVGGGYGGGSYAGYSEINPGGGGGNCAVYNDVLAMAHLGAGGDGSDGGSIVNHWSGSGDGGASNFGGGSRGAVGYLNDQAGYPIGSGGGGSTVRGMPGTNGTVIFYW
jgi:hypothetical protein